MVGTTATVFPAFFRSMDHFCISLIVLITCILTQNSFPILAATLFS